MMDDPCTVSAFLELGTEWGSEHHADTPTPMPTAPHGLGNVAKEPKPIDGDANCRLPPATRHPPPTVLVDVEGGSLPLICSLRHLTAWYFSLFTSMPILYSLQPHL
jgi:hypothetical protein